MKKIINYFNIESFGDLVLKIAKIIFLLAFSICIPSVIYTTMEHFPNMIEETRGSNLGLLLQSLQKNWLISFIFSFIITYLSFAFWMFFALIFNLNTSKKFFKTSFFCTFGIFTITFIFIFILASTKPSNNTIVFSVLSALGTSISFCYTVFNNNKG